MKRCNISQSLQPASLYRPSSASIVKSFILTSDCNFSTCSLFFILSSPPKNRTVESTFIFYLKFCMFLSVWICLKWTADFCGSSGSGLHHLHHVNISVRFLSPSHKVLCKIEGEQSRLPSLHDKNYEQLVKQPGFCVPCAHIALVVIIFL